MSGKQFSLDSRLDLFHGIETTPESNNLPVVEDSGEFEEKDTPSGSFFIIFFLFSSIIWIISDHDTSESHSPLRDNFDQPVGRHNRSKSVDHQMNLTINDLKVEKEICRKCGHKVEKVEKVDDF